MPPFADLVRNLAWSGDYEAWDIRSLRIVAQNVGATDVSDVMENATIHSQKILGGIRTTTSHSLLGKGMGPQSLHLHIYKAPTKLAAA